MRWSLVDLFYVGSCWACASVANPNMRWTALRTIFPAEEDLKNLYNAHRMVWVTHCHTSAETQKRVDPTTLYLRWNTSQIEEPTWAPNFLSCSCWWFRICTMFKVFVTNAEHVTERESSRNALRSTRNVASFHLLVACATSWLVGGEPRLMKRSRTWPADVNVFVISTNAEESVGVQFIRRKFAARISANASATSPTLPSWLLVLHPASLRGPLVSVGALLGPSALSELLPKPDGILLFLVDATLSALRRKPWASLRFRSAPLWPLTPRAKGMMRLRNELIGYVHCLSWWV